MSYPINNEVEGLLQEVSETAEELLWDLLNGELAITEDNISDWQAVVPALRSVFAAMVDLKRHKAEVVSDEPPDGTYDQDWARVVDAALCA